MEEVKTIQYRRELVDLLRHLNLPLIGVEVGVAEANFSRDLLAAGMDKLFLVDTWQHIPKVKGDGNSHQSWHDQNFAKAKRQVKPFGDKAVFLRGKSVEMAAKVPDESLSLVYIDADHSYEGVMGDLQAWFPKVVKGGVVAMHDFENSAYGVKQAAQDFCKGKYQLIPIPEDKQEDAGAYFIKQ
jgi:hypothetical protein